MDGFQNALTIATLGTILLMGASFGADRLWLQTVHRINVGENFRKVWGVLILAIGAAIFLFKAFPSDIALAVFAGLCCVTGLSGLADLLLHWAWSHAQLRKKAEEATQEAATANAKITAYRQWEEKKLTGEASE